MKKQMWTMAKIKALSKQELQEAIDRADGVHTVWSLASKRELIGQFVNRINQGKIPNPIVEC